MFNLLIWLLYSCIFIDFHLTKICRYTAAALKCVFMKSEKEGEDECDFFLKTTTAYTVYDKLFTLASHRS